MRASVRDTFVRTMVQWEGEVPWMYLDIIGLVTVGIGNLIDPVDTALDLPFVRPDGSPASRDEIRAAWWAVKNAPHLAQHGHRPAARYSTLRLTPDGIRSVVLRKVDQNHDILRLRFPDIDTWPADAEMATHSLAWACGPRFPFPRLAMALRARDFVAAVQHCHIDETGNPGLRPRNAGNKRMYRNAARVQAFGLEADTLIYPAELADTPPPAPPDTVPDTAAARIAGTYQAMREMLGREPEEPEIVLDDED